MTPQDLFDLIVLRDAEDSLTRAIGWTVCVYHVETEITRTYYGFFEQPAAAMEWAVDFAAGLNIEEETGFRCDAVPVMPS